MKIARRLISALLATIMALSMAGCGNKNTFQGGGNTNFPYTWKEESKGTILLTLSGSYGPEDYHWSAVSSDETILKVTVVKKEKKGKISFRVTPLAEGSAQITFVRERAVQGASQGTESAVVDNTTDKQEKVQDTKGENDAKDSDEKSKGAPKQASTETDDGAYASQVLEAYVDSYRAKDYICEIVVQMNSAPTGKKGKLKASLVAGTTREFQGIMQNAQSAQSDVSGFDYTLWEDANGMVQLRLPSFESEWNVNWQSDYVAPEDAEIPGIIIPVPEKENGKYVILEINNAGHVEGAQCYTIRGLFQGTAVIDFSNPEKDKHLSISVTITKDGVVTVTSHGLTVPQG